MLEKISARQFAEWMAYERVSGPLDSKWEDETVGQLHELMQAMVYMMGNKTFKKNPYKKPRHFPRPWEMHGMPEPEPEAEEDEAAEQAKRIAEFDRQAFGS